MPNTNPILVKATDTERWYLDNVYTQFGIKNIIVRTYHLKTDPSTISGKRWMRGKNQRYQIEEDEPIEEWMNTREYIRRICREERIKGTPKMPSKTYINRDTLICSNKKEYERGQFFSCCFYFIISYDEDNRYILSYSIQAPKAPISFEQIRGWALRYGDDILEKQWEQADFYFDRIIAYEFMREREHFQINPKMRTSKGKYEGRRKKN